MRDCSQATNREIGVRKRKSDDFASGSVNNHDWRARAVPYTIRPRSITALWTVCLTSAVLSSGCRVIQCPPAAESYATISLKRSDNALQIAGEVRTAAGVRLRHALVRLREPGALWHAADTRGEFVLRASEPGTYVLDIAADGYPTASGAMTISTNSGLFASIVMDGDRLARTERACRTK
jgi:hypothetical protein